MKKFNNLNRNRSKAHGYRFTVGRILQLVLALVFLVFIGRFLYIGISNQVAGENLNKRVNQIYRRNEVLKATRGTIYDKNGLTLAEDAHVFTVYAILDKSSIDYHNKPMYVTNKRKTAQKLAEVLPLSEEKIYSYLTPKHKAFQVEFGSAGTGLTLSQKKKIEAMKLPGIKFVETPSRLYPNGNFASHIIGLAQPQKSQGTSNLVGTMGIEAYFDKQLAGKDGYREAFVDAENYQLPNGQKTTRATQDGDNIYLTLDSRLQSYLEVLMSQVQDKYKPKALTAVVEDIKTGKILAASQRPTFNPQTKQGLDTSWRNILVQDSYEPGSVFKVLTYSSAIESGNYNPNEQYKSGAVTVQGSTIHDWNNSGWGSIPFSQAFPRSSNVGFVKLEQKMGAKTWKEYLNKYRIGKKTGVTLPGETAGILNFSTPLSQAVTAFGQGVNVNAMQMMQAYSALANNGQMVKPQFVEKIVSPSGKVVEKFHRTKVGAPIYSAKTAKTVLKGMQDVVNASYGTGAAYKMPGKSIAVKTGTAQIAGPHGGYLTGDNNYIFSVVGVTPANNPRYCVYLTMKQPQKMSKPAETILSSIFKPIMNRLISLSDSTAKVNEKVTVPALTGKSIEKAKEEANNAGVSIEIIGTGKTVSRQSVSAGVKQGTDDKIFLFTGGQVTCPNMIGWTEAEVNSFMTTTDIPITINGKGKVTKQSIPSGKVIDKNSKLSVNLK